MITLNQQEVTELQNYCLEMPGKYGISIINFLNAKVQQAQQEQAVKASPEEAILPPAPEEIAKMDVVAEEVEPNQEPSKEGIY
jgi:hypothetical protein